MSITVNVPEEIYQKAAELARKQNVTVDEIFVSAVEQLAAWEQLQQRAARGNRKKFLSVLDKAPDIEPEEHDQRW